MLDTPQARAVLLLAAAVLMAIGMFLPRLFSVPGEIAQVSINTGIFGTEICSTVGCQAIRLDGTILGGVSILVEAWQFVWRAVSIVSLCVCCILCGLEFMGKTTRGMTIVLPVGIFLFLVGSNAAWLQYSWATYAFGLLFDVSTFTTVRPPTPGISFALLLASTGMVIWIQSKQGDGNSSPA